MKNNELVKELAEQMGVSAIDVAMLAQSVINSMKADKVTDAFIGASEQGRTALAEAYVVQANKKFQKFHNAYLTKPQLKQNVDESVLALLQH